MKLETGKKYKIVAFHPDSCHYENSPHLVGAVVTCVKDHSDISFVPGTATFDFVANDQIPYFTLAAYVEEVNEIERESIIVSGICIDTEYKYMTVEKNGTQYVHTDFPIYDSYWHTNENTNPLSNSLKINTKLKGEDALFEIIRHEDKIEFLQILKRPDLKVDDILIVSNYQNLKHEEWRYFSHWAEDGEVVCFPNGKTSITTSNSYIPVLWKYYRVPTEAEIKERRESNQGE